MNGASDAIEIEAESEFEQELRTVQSNSPVAAGESLDQNDGKKVRDQIAQAMRVDYVRICELRRQRRQNNPTQ